MEDTKLPTENEACVMTAIGQLENEKRPLPKDPGPFGVIVAPKKNWSLWAGESVFDKPLVLGHEAAGVVTKIGCNVTRFNVGDRIAMEPGICCLRCEFCLGGSYGQCGEFKFAAADGFDGTLQSLFTIPEQFCYKLPENVTMAEDALVEPLSVAVMAVHSVAQMPHNANIAVLGAGPVGLLRMAVAKALGARRILAIDVQPQRLEFAKQYAATDVHLAIAKEAGEDMMAYSKRHAKHIMDKFGFGERGEGIDLVIECSGAEVCVQTGIWLVKRRGTCVQVGAGPANNLIPMSIFVNKEVRLIGSLRYGPGCYALAVDLVRQGRIDLKPLITHRFPFEQASDAFKTTKAGVGPDGNMAIKTIIDGPVVA